MKSTTFGQFRKNLVALLDRVTEDREPLIITRGRGKPAAVLMSYEDFTAFDETDYLMRAPKNAERLLASIAEFEQAKGRRPT